MRGIILSHTRMFGEGFCTSLGIFDGDQAMQIRPRLAPNANMRITSFGLSEAEMLEDWRPGRPLEFERFEPVQQLWVRQTHPEDVVFPPQRIELLPPLDRDEFEGRIAQFTHRSLAELFPGLQNDGNGKAYVSWGKHSRSLGYVRCPLVAMRTAYDGKIRVHLMDNDGAAYDLPLKDVHLLNAIRSGASRKETRDVSVRFALAGSLRTLPWGEERCYAMVTHILM